MNDRNIPPQSIESEMSIIGSIFIEAGAIDTVHSIITVDDFYRQSHRVIFTAMASLIDKNEPVDLVTVAQALKIAGTLEEAGGGAYLYTLVDYVPTAANVAHYCRTVKEASRARKVLSCAQDAVHIIYSQKPLDEALVKLEEAIQPNVNQSSEPVGMVQCCRETYKRIEKRQETRGQIHGIRYGFDELDVATSGMQRGDLIVVAGRPSMGKSAFLGNVTSSVCRQGLSALLFTLEMSRAGVNDRLVAEVGIKYHHIRTGELEPHEWAKLSDAMDVLHKWPLKIDDKPAISLREIRAKARRQKRNGLDFIGIDYLQLMAVAGKNNRVQEIGEISRGLKQLARELDVPVMILSQLNRGVDARQDKRPLMSDLRESGEIEQDADVILFPFRPAAYCQKCRDKIVDNEHDYREHNMKAEIIIEKQREGERNLSIPVMWRGEYQRFVGIKIVDRAAGGVYGGC